MSKVHYQLDVATRRLTEFGDMEAIESVLSVACQVLRQTSKHEVATLRLAAQAIVIGQLCDDSCTGVLNGVASVCGSHRVCCTNKVLRAKEATHAQYPVPPCIKEECNLHLDHQVTPVDARRCDNSYITPDEFIPVIDR